LFTRETDSAEQLLGEAFGGGAGHDHFGRKAPRRNPPNRLEVRNRTGSGVIENGDGTRSVSHVRDRCALAKMGKVAYFGCGVQRLLPTNKEIPQFGGCYSGLRRK